MSEIKSFEDLEVWRGGIDLTMRCYAIVATLPSSERFELSSQMRRCAVSIPANIAEGHARRLPRPFLNHVNIALGSLAEWVTYLVIAERLGFITNATFKTERSDAERMAQMLGGLARALERRISRFKLGMTVGATALCVVAEPGGRRLDSGRSPDPSPSPRIPSPESRDPTSQ